PDLAGLLSLRNARVELPRRRVVKEQRAAVSVGLARGQFNERAQDLVEGLHRGHRPRHVDERLRQAKALGLLRERAVRALVAVTRHLIPPAVPSRPQSCPSAGRVHHETRVPRRPSAACDRRPGPPTPPEALATTLGAAQSRPWRLVPPPRPPPVFQSRSVRAPPATRAP